jgi:predicted nucleic acid-binding Zn ribbon protein
MLGEYRYELFTRPRFTIICRWCGRTAYYTDWVWRVVCSDYCRDRLRPSSQTRAAARIGRPCEVCGDPFTPPRSDGRYCSPACRQKAYRRRNRGGG